MSNFWTVWFLKTESELKFGFPHIPTFSTRLVTGMEQCDHITPVFRQLHWLPVCQRICFKVASCVFQALPAKHTPTSPTTVA